jgi:excisionase family DNA binding protein
MQIRSITQGIQSAEPEKLLSIEACAEMTSLSAWTIRKWIQTGKIRSNKLGARRLVPLSEIRRLIADSAVPRLDVKGSAV